MAESLLGALEAYLALGGVFALAFITRGAAAVEPTARGGTLGFRVALLPGAIVLWPYLLVRWVRAVRRAGR